MSQSRAATSLLQTPVAALPGQHNGSAGIVRNLHPFGLRSGGLPAHLKGADDSIQRER